MTDTDRDFVPALGKSGSLDRYDAAIALMTREKRWRSDLLKLVAPQPGDRIVDIGCGTGTLAIALKGGEPESEIFRSEERRVGKEFGMTYRSRWSPYH